MAISLACLAITRERITVVGHGKAGSQDESESDLSAYLGELRSNVILAGYCGS
jgi:hypothetical protein